MNKTSSTMPSFVKTRITPSMSLTMTNGPLRQSETYPSPFLTSAYTTSPPRRRKSFKSCQLHRDESPETVTRFSPLLYPPGPATNSHSTNNLALLHPSHIPLRELPLSRSLRSRLGSTRILPRESNTISIVTLTCIHLRPRNSWLSMSRCASSASRSSWYVYERNH